MSFSLGNKQGVSLLSVLLVALQFSFVGGVAVMGSMRLAGIPLLIAIAGAALGLWAIWVMRRARFRIVPDVHDAALMVQAGPYRYIRHPMYAALLIMMLSFVLHDFSVGRLLLWVGLLFDLLVKLIYEESLLRHSFANYAKYCSKTWRLFPFVW